ncbi:hypothetical protein Acr_11g0003200 [Actinidia rufa]|uniref:Uncharacterized protein n=1 Tax=Actinidia rufa TaxID=165716 RepID=A0A7J0FBA2_9ERIC|nr:hypothetical protein Acr_11g0003200 [Actinidia rufa]
MMVVFSTVFYAFVITNGHYLMDYVKKEETNPNRKIPEAEPDENNSEAESMDELTQGTENIPPCEMQSRHNNLIDDYNLIDETLMLPYEAKYHFTEVKIPPSPHEMGRMCFTDARNKNWLMEVTFKK